TGPLATATAWRWRLPYVLSSHGSDIPGHNPDRFRLEHALLKPAWRAVVRRASSVICPSEWLGRLVRQNMPSAGPPVHVIPHGIDCARFDPTRPRRKRVLLVGRLLKQKGIHYLLHAASHLPSGWEVCIAGDGPYRPHLERLAAEVAPAAKFLGWIDSQDPRLVELYETSAIFAFPADKEAFGMALLEAMAAGCAVVTTDASGCSEVVGDSGVIVPPHDAAALGDALSGLARDERRAESLGRRARARANRTYSWRAAAARYAELLQQAAGG
ncbi:MAG: glycosyltransferase family 4 protein, partial [Armatimonadota bacterium]